MRSAQIRFVVHDYRRGTSYPVFPETVRGALGPELFDRLVEQARYSQTGTFAVQFRGDVWEAVRSF